MSTGSSLTERIENLIAKGNAVLATHTPNPPNVIGYPTLSDGLFEEWRTQSLRLLTTSAGQKDPYTESFSKIKGAYYSSVETGLGILRAFLQDVNASLLDSPKAVASPLIIIEHLCTRFVNVARQLRRRYGERATIDVQDEYDVQDLLHALLQLHFDDIRPEEYTPSYAGSASRMDFLLKRESIVVEVKKTRSSLGVRELSIQLMEDIERYKAHPNCRTLICFVFDPDGFIPNPRGIEDDLSRDYAPLVVRVFIRP